MELRYGKVTLPPWVHTVPADVTRPHRCPICEGRGTVAAGFYTPGLPLTNTKREKCRSCSGRGIVFA